MFFFALSIWNCRMFFMDINLVYWFRKPRRLMAVQSPSWGSVSRVTGVTCCSRFQTATAAASSCVVRLCRRRESWPRSTWWISSSQTWHWEKSWNFGQMGKFLGIHWYYWYSFSINYCYEALVKPVENAGGFPIASIAIFPLPVNPASPVARPPSVVLHRADLRARSQQ